MDANISPRFDRHSIAAGGRRQRHQATRLRPLPRTFSPQLAVLAEKPPEGDGWIHEIKFDGYRILAFVKRGDVRLITRNGHDWTDKFPAIAQTLFKLKAKNAIVDGELVVLDAEGRSDFQALQASLKGETPAKPVFYAFDLPFCDGEDLTTLPLLARKARLETLLKRSRIAASVSYSSHVTTPGAQVLAEACRLGLEGIISKRADGPYFSRRDASWLKSKCSQRQEFIVIGFTPPQGQRTGFGALLLGYHGDDHQLTYAGRVGTGFNEALLGDLLKQLKSLEVHKYPTALPPPARERHNAHWIKPKLIAEVRFTGWTRDGLLRHPAFIALRSDKSPGDIIREKPIEPPMKSRQTKTSASTSPRSSRRQSRPGRPASDSSSDRSDAQSSSDNQRLTIDGVSLSHPHKLLFAEPPISKQAIAEYYDVVARWMLPHVIDRPLALVRCPNGQSGKCFFQRNWSATMPEAVGSANIGEGKSRELHVTVHDLAGVISLVQIGVLEIHTWNCKTKDIERPDQLIFDLDPGPDVPWKRVIESAHMLHRTLDKLKLPQFLKTSGGKGLHLTIPIKPTVDWDSAKRFCETIAKSLADQSPDMFVANMRKDLRGGKVYIDYLRNGRGATAVAPYSTRARAGAAVSMPISWEELGKLSSAAHFTVETAGQYLKKRKTDPWRAFERSRIDLRKLVNGKSTA